MTSTRLILKLLKSTKLIHAVSELTAPSSICLPARTTSPWSGKTPVGSAVGNSVPGRVMTLKSGYEPAVRLPKLADTGRGVGTGGIWILPVSNCGGGRLRRLANWVHVSKTFSVLESTLTLMAFIFFLSLWQQPQNRSSGSELASWTTSPELTQSLHPSSCKDWWLEVTSMAIIKISLILRFCLGEFQYQCSENC